MGRVYIMNSECVVVTTTTTTVVTTTTTIPITTTTTTQDWSECIQCPPGYEAVAQGCIQYDEVAATYSGTTYTVVKKASDPSYSVYGGLMFSSWNYNGTGTFEWFAVSPLNTYWTNRPYPSSAGAMNRTSVWASTTASNQDIGFSVCIEITIPKTYYIGIGCDSYSKIMLNGEMILEQNVSALKAMFGSLGMSSAFDDGVTFKYWYIYPVYLPQGQNVIEIRGHNVASVAGVGIEVYDATPSEIMNATSDADLAGKFLFRSQDLVGQTLFYEHSTGGGFHGYSCTEGYALSTCGETVMCVKRDFIPCQGGTTTTTTIAATTTTTVIPDEFISQCFGMLYNFYSIENINNIAPTGYRVSTLDDIVGLINYLGTESTSGGKMKKTDIWSSPNTGATNESGFTAVPAGIRTETGAFADILLKNTIWIDNR